MTITKTKNNQDNSEQIYEHAKEKNLSETLSVDLENNRLYQEISNNYDLSTPLTQEQYFTLVGELARRGSFEEAAQGATLKDALEASLEIVPEMEKNGFLKKTLDDFFYKQKQKKAANSVEEKSQELNDMLELAYELAPKGYSAEERIIIPGSDSRARKRGYEGKHITEHIIYSVSKGRKNLEVDVKYNEYKTPGGGKDKEDLFKIKQGPGKTKIKVKNWRSCDEKLRDILSRRKNPRDFIFWYLEKREKGKELSSQGDFDMACAFAVEKLREGIFSDLQKYSGRLNDLEFEISSKE